TASIGRGVSKSGLTGDGLAAKAAAAKPSRAVNDIRRMGDLAVRRKRMGRAAVGYDSTFVRRLHAVEPSSEQVTARVGAVLLTSPAQSLPASPRSHAWRAWRPASRR